MLKNALAALCLTLSVGSQAAIVTTTYEATIKNAYGLGDVASIGNVVTINITYDDAGTVMHVWGDGTNGIAENGSGDDTVNSILKLADVPAYDFIADASISFIGLPPAGGTPRDARNENLQRALRGNGSFEAQFEADSFAFGLNDRLGSNDDTFVINFALDPDVLFAEYVGTTLTHISTVPAVPIPAAAYLFISALGGLVVAKRRQRL